MPFIAVRDIQMYYEIHGTGPRVLFFNGTGGDLRAKPSIFDSPLAQHFEILAHDQRGLGQTDRPDIPCTMADYAIDANGLLEAVGWDSCGVLVMSFGGMVAQECALRYPNRIQRLVMACTSSGGAGGDSYPVHEFGDLAIQELLLRLIQLIDTRRDAAERVQELMDQVVAGSAVGADEPGREVGARRQLEARIGHNAYDRLPNLKMPVSICGGRYDGMVPVANLEAIHRQVPHSRLELFDGGHLFHLQDSRAFERIATFLQGALDESRHHSVAAHT